MNGKHLKKKLEGTNLPMKYIAEKLGLSPQSLSQMFKTADVRSGLVEQICSALNLPISYFYDEPPTMERNEATANGTGSGASIRGNVKIINQAAPTPEACATLLAADDDDPRVLRERIRGLEAQLKLQEDLINVLKSQK